MYEPETKNWHAFMACTVKISLEYVMMDHTTFMHFSVVPLFNHKEMFARLSKRTSSNLKDLFLDKTHLLGENEIHFVSYIFLCSQSIKPYFRGFRLLTGLVFDFGNHFGTFSQEKTRSIKFRKKKISQCSGHKMPEKGVVSVRKVGAWIKPSV